jgi:hypothetical protein
LCFLPSGRAVSPCDVPLAKGIHRHAHTEQDRAPGRRPRLPHHSDGDDRGSRRDDRSGDRGHSGGRFVTPDLVVQAPIAGDPAVLPDGSIAWAGPNGSAAAGVGAGVSGLTIAVLRP